MSDTRILCSNGGFKHTHGSVEESRACYGLTTRTASPTVSTDRTRPSVLLGPVSYPKPVTEAQLDYIERLGGRACRLAAKYLDRKSASALIDELKHPEREVTPLTSTPTPPPTRRVDERHEMIAGLLGMVSDGYYAVHEYEGGPVTFLRISRPKKNKWAGCIKVQTVHGSFGKVRLSSEPVAALWPSGTFSVFKHGMNLEDSLLILVADARGAARRYAKLLGHCCRCNAELTDDRSRHYGIGPECVKHWPHVIEEVDMEDAIKEAEAAL